MGYQYRIKRFIAYSSISHLGFLLLALSHLDLNNYYIYYWIYIFTTINIFLIFIIILKGPIEILKKENSLNMESKEIIKNKEYINYNDLVYLNQFKGLFLINKPLTIALGINFLSLAGIPPLAGFFAKAWIFISLIHFSDWISAFITILTTTIGTAYYIKFYRIINLDSTSLNYTPSTSFSLIPNSFIAHLISFLTILLLFFMFKPLFLLSNIAYSLF